jgi:hypothetical protein
MRNIVVAGVARSDQAQGARKGAHDKRAAWPIVKPFRL